MTTSHLDHWLPGSPGPMMVSFFNDDFSPRWVVFYVGSDAVLLLDVLVNFRTGLSVGTIVYRTRSSIGWLGSRVVSVLDSGAEGPGFKSHVATLSGNSLRQTVHTHCASVHQATKLVAALLRVAGVTAGLAESNGSLPPGLCRTSPAG